MYDSRSNLIIGFHGCEEETARALLTNPDVIKESTKPYDWLGHGMYFWENNQERAFQWAKTKFHSGQNKKPAVIGAVIQLGYCCDLLDSRYTDILKHYSTIMVEWYELLGIKLPENRNPSKSISKDKVVRELDCTLIEFMHSEILTQYKKDIEERDKSDLKLFDSTRGVFLEGERVLQGSEIYEKSHIQICVRNPNCILGFFLSRKEIDPVKYLLDKGKPADF
jgi:hypothetical protein